MVSLSSVRPKTIVEKANVDKDVASMIGDGMSNGEISKALEKKGKELTSQHVGTFRKKVLAGVVDYMELDGVKPTSTFLAEKYLKSDELMVENLDELRERMENIKDDREWLEFVKEKRQHIELIMRKAGELDTVKQAVQVNVANVITPEQFAGKANDYVFSLVKEGKLKIVSPELEQEYVRWLK